MRMDTKQRPRLEDFPIALDVESLRYWRTGKVGHDNATGEESAEYSARYTDDDGTQVEARAWRTASGRVSVD